jgi:SET domain
MEQLHNNKWTNTIVSSHGFCEIRLSENETAKAVFALQHFNKGENISVFSSAALLKEPTYLTVQIGLAEHIHLQPEFLQYINHSCEPNVLFNTDTMQLEALQNIRVGDELRFFYPATEWDMAQPFDCLCETPSCIRKIKGAKYLDKKILANYKFTAFITQMLSSL